ncbi:retroelement silencing factor 1 isoform X2 [Pleurodeles waltl]|uniref:retroelement silencing factor 1 isoform X2 n=1 Tax=Pleurodeles waltl TaxID=8319 RepID=UPI003709A0D6
MDRNAGKENLGSRIFPEQAYFPNISALCMYLQNQQTQLSCPPGTQSLYPNIVSAGKSLTPNNYSGNSISEQQSKISGSSEVLAQRTGNLACSESNGYAWNNECLQNSPRANPTFMQVPCCVSSATPTHTSESPSQSLSSTGNLKAQLVQPPPYMFTSGTGSDGQQAFPQQLHSVNDHGTYIANQKCNTFSNGMQLVRVPPQNSSQPVFQPCTKKTASLRPIKPNLTSQQNPPVPNEQTKVSCAHAAVMVSDVPHQNMHKSFQANPQYLHPPTSFMLQNALQNTPVSKQCTITYVLPKETNMHVSSQPNVQSRDNFADAAVSNTRIPRQSSYSQAPQHPTIVSNQNSLSQHNHWIHDFIASSATQPVQCQLAGLRNEMIQNQHLLTNSITSGNHSPTADVCQMKGGSYVTQHNYCNSLQPENTVASFSHSKTGSNNSNKAEVAISQSKFGNGSAIQSTRFASNDQGPHTPKSGPLVKSRPACNPEINNCLKEQLKAKANSLDTQNAVLTEEDMISEVKILMQAKEYFINCFNAFKEKRKIFKSSKCNTNMPVNKQGPNFSGNLNSSYVPNVSPKLSGIATDLPPPPPCTAQTHASLTPMTSERLVNQKNQAQHTIVEQQGNFTDRSPNFGIELLDKYCYSDSAALASISPATEDRNIRIDRHSEGKYSQPDNTPTAGHAWMPAQSAACSGLLTTDTVDLEEKTNVDIEPVGFCQSNGQLNVAAQRIEKTAELQSEKHNIISNGQSSSVSPSLAQLSERNAHLLKFSKAFNTVEKDPQDQSRSSYANKSDRSSLLTELLADAICNLSKLAETNPGFPNSPQQHIGVPPTNNSVLTNAVSQSCSNSVDSALEIVSTYQHEPGKIMPNLLQTKAGLSVADEHILKSCIGILETPASNRPAQCKPLPNTNVDPPLPCTDTCAKNDIVQKNEKPTINMCKKIFPLNNINGAHQSTVDGQKQDSLSLNVVKTGEPQVAIVNPLILSKLKSPIADQDNKSVQLESSPIVQQDSVCSLLDNKAQCMLIGAPQTPISDMFSEAKLSHLTNIKPASCKSEPDTALIAATDKCEIVTPSDHTDCPGSNENDINQCPQTAKLRNPVENCQMTDSVGVLLHEKLNSLKPQTSPLSIENSFSMPDLSVSDTAPCIEDAYDEQLKISSFCTLVEGSRLYDSQIAQMFDNISASCLTSQENVVSDKGKELECNHLKTSVAADLKEQQLVGVDESKHLSPKGQFHISENCDVTNEHRLIKCNPLIAECLLENKTEQMQTCLDSGLVEIEPVDKQVTPNENQNPSGADMRERKKGIFSREQLAENYTLMHMQSKTLDLETLPSNDDLNQDEHSSEVVSHTNNNSSVNEFYDGTFQNVSSLFLNDQLSALQEEFPYGLEQLESTHCLADKHLLPEKKDFDTRDCTIAGDSPPNPNTFPLVGCGPNTDSATDCVTEQSVSGNKAVPTRLGNNDSVSSPGKCDSQQSTLIQSIPDWETPQGHAVPFDKESNIFPEDFSDCEKDDSVGNIEITVLDSEQILTFFPEMSSQSVTNTNTQGSQQQSQCHNTIKAEASETELCSDQRDPASLKSTDNCSSTKTKLFCCLYRWLSSDYNDVPKCSCAPIHNQDSTASPLGSNQTHVKEEPDNSANVKYPPDGSPAGSIEAGGVQTLSLSQNHKKRRNESATQGNVNRSMGDGHTSPMAAKHRPSMRNLNQPLNKTKPRIKSKDKVKKRWRKDSVGNSDSGETSIRMKCNVRPSEDHLPNGDLCVNNSLPLVDDKQRRNDSLTEKKHSYLALQGKMKNGKLVLETDFRQQFRHSTFSRPAHVPLNMNDTADEINTPNKKREHVEVFSHIQNRTQHNSESETCFAGKKPANIEMSKGKLLATEPGPSQWNRAESNVNALYQSNHAETVVDRHTSKVKEYFERRKTDHKKAAKKTSMKCNVANKKKVMNPIQKRKSHNFKVKKRDFALENKLAFHVSPGSVEDVEPIHQDTPQKSFVTNSCSSADVNAFCSTEHKSNRLCDKRVKKRDNNAFILNREADNQKKTSVPGQETKGSSKHYLNRVAFKNTSAERIHLARLEFGFSPGKLIGTRKSQKALDSSAHAAASQKVVEKSQLLEFKLCPDVLFNCSAMAESHENGIALPDKEKSSIEGIRSRKEDWLKNIPLKKRKVDMNTFQDGGLIATTLSEVSTSPAEGPAPQAQGSKAIFHAYKQLYLEKRKKSADTTPQS